MKSCGLELLRHILEPSRKIDDKYKSRTVLTLDGKTHNGFVIFENEMEIRITSDPLSNNAPIVIKKSEIDQEKLSNLSPMPVGARIRSINCKCLTCSPTSVARQRRPPRIRSLNGLPHHRKRMSPTPPLRTW